MSVPRKTTEGSEVWILQRSLDGVVLPKWLQEASLLIMEAKDGDTVYVSSRLDMAQIQAGADHAQKTFKVIVDPVICRGGYSPAPHQNVGGPSIPHAKRVNLSRLTYPARDGYLG